METPSTSVEALRVVNVSKAFGALRAVDGISLTLQSGEIVGIAGPNGSGKSTLLNIITGIPFNPDDGEVWLGDVCVTDRRPHMRFRLGLSRTFQTETCFEQLSVESNLKVAAKYGGSKSITDRLVREVMDYVELDEGLITHQAGTVSVLDRKKLMMATAIVTGPKVLLLDEPAAGLGEKEVDRIKELIVKIRESGVAIVLVEHIMPLLLSVSDRILVMNHGQSIMVGKPDEVVSDRRVIEAYLGGTMVA